MKTERKRGVKAPELHQGGNTLWTEKKTAGTRGGTRQRKKERGREETTLTVPRMAQILLSGGRYKKDFREGSKKTKILLGC